MIFSEEDKVCVGRAVVEWLSSSLTEQRGLRFESESHQFDFSDRVFPASKSGYD